MDIAEARAVADRARDEPLISREELRAALLAVSEHLAAAERRMVMAAGILKNGSGNHVENPAAESSSMSWTDMTSVVTGRVVPWED